MAVILLPALIVFTQLSCQKAYDLSAREKQEIKEEVKVIVDSLLYTSDDGKRLSFDDLRNKYLDTANGFWLGNPGYDMEHPGPTLSTEENLSLFWPGIEKISQSDDFFNIEKFYAVIDRDRVLVVLSANIVEGPGEPPSGKGWAGSFVWIRKDEGWKLLHFQVSLSRAYSIIR